MKEENTIKLFAALMIGSLTAYFKILAVPLTVLAAVMVIDYISGMLKAWVTSSLSSRTGIRGIVKKVGYLFIVAVAAVVDWLIHSVCGQLGVSVQTSMCIGQIVSVWLIINELISILENLAAVGVPLPIFLTKLVGRLKAAVENRTKEE